MDLEPPGSFEPDLLQALMPDKLIKGMLEVLVGLYVSGVVSKT